MNTSFKEDYYRMTGTVYKPGLRSLVQWFIAHQIRYVYWWRKANKNSNILNRMILKRYSKKVWFGDFSKCENRKRIIPWAPV